MVSLVAGVRRRPLACYFVCVYALTAVALVVIGLPRLDAASGRSWAPLAMFPVMVIGVGIAGVMMTFAVSGKSGIVALRSRWTVPVRGRWLAVLLIPPAGILGVLTALRLLVSPNFAPNFLVFGIGAGILAAFFEELGWTGFAYPRMRAKFGALRGALLLGLLWAVWHLPVIDSLGAASPHGAAWPAFAGSFVAVMIPLRVLISWTYNATGSLLMAQLLHASSTGFLVVLGAPRVSAAQEAAWYLAYAGVLWLAVAAVLFCQTATLAYRSDETACPRHEALPLPAMRG